MKNKFILGISTLEVIITLSILSVISVASVWLVFSTLSLRDQALATTTTSESLRIFSRSVAKAVQNASVITTSGTSLLTTSANECWSFIYDSNTQKIYYSQVLAAGCSPNLSPTDSFFPSYSQIPSFTVLISPMSTGGRQVSISGVINTILPFDNYQTVFSETFANVID